MDKLMKYGQDFIKKMDVKDMALLKICLIAIGVMVGLSISKKHKKMSFMCAMALFIATYIPIMGKFLQGCLEE